MLNQAVLSGRYVLGTIIWQVYEGPSHFISFKLKPEKIIFTCPTLQVWTNIMI